jgi:hypothetical protein
MRQATEQRVKSRQTKHHYREQVRVVTPVAKRLKASACATAGHVIGDHAAQGC